MRLIKLLPALILSICAFSCFAQDTIQHIVQGRSNSPEQIGKHYVILISSDGFRHDFAKKYHAKNLLEFSKKGVRAEYLQPSYPSLTFPNHYSIATGMYPSHHGIVDNTMFDKNKNAVYSLGNHKEVADSSWYGGIPIWVLAEQHKMLSASFFWVGSETAVTGVRPTYYYNYSDKINIDTRIEAVKKWLELPEEKRPHLITFYFNEPDHTEHKYGPESKETEEAVKLVDESIRKLTDALAPLNLDIDYVFVSDHGMTAVDTKNTLSLPASVDTTKFRVLGGSSIIHLYARDRDDDIQAAYSKIKKEANDFDVYLAAEMPERWHYSKKEDVYDRIGDILLVPHLPKVFNLGKYPANIGNHGFDPELEDMHATFYAWGPDFKKKMQIPGFENVNIYPLIARLLGLSYDQKIDGDLKVLMPILK